MCRFQGGREHNKNESGCKHTGKCYPALCKQGIENWAFSQDWCLCQMHFVKQWIYLLIFNNFLGIRIRIL